MELGESLLGPQGHLVIGRHHLQQNHVGLRQQPHVAVHLSRVEGEQHCVKDVRVHLHYHHQSSNYKMKSMTVLKKGMMLLTRVVSVLGWASSCYTWYSER